MKILLWSIGRTHEPSIAAAIEDFTRRIGRYFPVEWNLISPPKNASTLSPAGTRRKEAELLHARLSGLKTHYLVTLDERGRQWTSEELAGFLHNRAGDSGKDVVFLIGGVYGLEGSVLDRADHRWSLTQLTLPHQLVRLLLAEQLYRACTILRNEKYHHG